MTCVYFFSELSALLFPIESAPGLAGRRGDGDRAGRVAGLDAPVITARGPLSRRGCAAGWAGPRPPRRHHRARRELARLRAQHRARGRHGLRRQRPAAAAMRGRARGRRTARLAALELDQLTIRGAHVTVLRREDGRLVLLGLDELNAAPPAPAAQEAFKHWVARQPRLAIEDSVLEWRDLTPGGRTFRLHGTRVAIRNRDGRHRLDADLALPESLGTRLAITAELSGDLFLPDEWSGDIYLRGERLALGAWGARTWPAVDLRSGGADIELWSDWRKCPLRITCTVIASDVQLSLQHALREDIQREAPQSADAPAPSTQPPPTTSSTAVVSNQDSLLANPPRQNPASDKSPLASSSEVSPGVCASAAAATSPDARASAAECDAFAADAHTATTPLDEAVPAMAKEAAAASAPLVTLAALRAQFQWQRTSEGWEFDAERVGLRIGEREEGPPSEWRVVYRAADGAHAQKERNSRVRIEDARALARAAGLVRGGGGAARGACAARGAARYLSAFPVGRRGGARMVAARRISSAGAV